MVKIFSVVSWFIKVGNCATNIASIRYFFLAEIDSCGFLIVCNAIEKEILSNFHFKMFFLP